MSNQIVPTTVWEFNFEDNGTEEINPHGEHPMTQKVVEISKSVLKGSVDASVYVGEGICVHKGLPVEQAHIIGEGVKVVGHCVVDKSVDLCRERIDLSVKYCSDSWNRTVSLGN